LKQTFEHVESVAERHVDSAPGSSTTTDSQTGSSKVSNGNSTSGKSGVASTANTSLDSKLQSSSSGNKAPKDDKTGSSERRQHDQHHQNQVCGVTGARRGPAARSSPDSNLTTIQETPLDQTNPSVLTVERAAAAKIFLETYFNEKLSSGPDPRNLRLRLIEADLYKQGLLNGRLAPSRLEAVRAHFYHRESEHLRETRVMKVRSIKALVALKGSPESCLVNDYEVIKILGKGSFGVVRLVREKKAPSQQVYAMKVIRKSAMLRTSQEGHLRAERDFLVASEGSRW